MNAFKIRGKRDLLILSQVIQIKIKDAETQWELSYDFYLRNLDKFWYKICLSFAFLVPLLRSFELCSISPEISAGIKPILSGNLTAPYSSIAVANRLIGSRA